MEEKFFLFRTERWDGVEGYFYIQHLISPSHDNGLSASAIPELSWRAQSLLEIEKMKFLIKNNKFYKDKD